MTKISFNFAVAFVHDAVRICIQIQLGDLILLTYMHRDHTKHNVDVNASTRSTAARARWIMRSGFMEFVGLGQPPMAVTPLYVHVISRPYRGRFTTAFGPRSVLGMSWSLLVKPGKARAILPSRDHRSRIRRIVFPTLMPREYFSLFPCRIIIQLQSQQKIVITLKYF